ncbi:hypothetical protein RUM44_005088 [Polyplax serrata]|uniref:Uncharacterized protein n=1 Tax=Polyplax serrata TaxID=468196 RepID=A0ABR1AE13_POLSC
MFRKYFFSTVLQFQLHRHLCRVSGQFDPNDTSRPLHKCDIYRKPQAGNVLKEIMRHGSSLTWNEVLSRATGENRLDGTAVRDFFRPLEEWLRNENLRTQEYPGWIYGKRPGGTNGQSSIATSPIHLCMNTYIDRRTGMSVARIVVLERFKGYPAVDNNAVVLVGKLTR